MKEVLLIVDNVRSTHNVGAFFRTADCLGVRKLFLCGITPYPLMKNDPRLPHLATKINSQIHKTALGAESSVPWQYFSSTEEAISTARSSGFVIAALEQHPRSVPLGSYQAPQKIALIAGPEVTGISVETLNVADVIIEIPQFGRKESLNVSVATGIALYALLG